MNSTSFKFASKFAFASVFCLGLTSLAKADSTLSFTNTIPSQVVDWNLGVSLPQFDPSLGALQSVTLTFDGGLSSVLTIINTSPDTSSSGTAKTEIQMFVDDSGHNINGPGNAVLDFLSSGFAYSLAAGEQTTSGTKTGEASISSGALTSGTILAEFTGTGSEVLNASTFTQTDLSNTGGPTVSAQASNAGLITTVTYDYVAPTPEPSTMLLLGLGGLGAAAFRRRFAK